MPTRSDWPQEDFLGWLDGVKKGLRIGSDLQLAEHLGVGHTLISGWRSGRQRPSIGAINKIAKATGEDPLRLWVLAGIVDPESAGPLGDRPAIDPSLPDEVKNLIAAYKDPRLTDDDRAVLLQSVRLFLAGFLAGINEREAKAKAAKRPPRGRSAA